MTRHLTPALFFVPTFLALAACDVPCGPQIVQVDATRDVVRIRNTCPGEIDVTPLQVCAGNKYADACKPIPVATMQADTCVEVETKLPHDSIVGFGVGVFGACADPKTDWPLDNFVYGATNTALADPDGVVRKPVRASVPHDTAATYGRFNWWYSVPTTRTPISCFTWAHKIIVEDAPSCEPQLVEVHPGFGSSYVKLSIQPGCEPIDLEDLAVGVGLVDVDAVFALPDGQLKPGLQVVVGDQTTVAVNGWAQWSWSQMYSGAYQSLGLLDQDSGIVVLWHDDKIVSGVSWGKAEMPGVFHVDSVNQGRSLIWKGDQWHLGVASPNQLPRWIVLDDVALDDADEPLALAGTDPAAGEP